MTEPKKDKTVTKPAAKPELKVVPAKPEAPKEVAVKASKPPTDLVATGVIKHAKMEPKHRFGGEVHDHMSDPDTPNMLEELTKAGVTNAKFKVLARPMGGFGRSRRFSNDADVPTLSEIETDKQYLRVDFELATTGMWVMGVKLKPVKTGIRKATSHNVRNFGKSFDLELGDLNPAAMWFGYRTNAKDVPDDAVFDVYQFELDGQYFTYLLDATSKVWIKEDTLDQLVLPWQQSRRQVRHDMGGGAILVDSQLFNCLCYNAVTLIGARAFNSLFSDATVNNGSEKPVKPDDLPWGNGGRFNWVPEDSRENQKLRRVYLERSHVTRSTLPPSDYFSSHFTESKIDSNNQVRVEHSSMEKSQVKAEQSVCLYYANLRNYTLKCKTTAQIANQTLADAYVDIDALWAPNKLSVSVFENPLGSSYRSIKMFQIDRETMELSGGVVNDNLRLKLWKGDAETKDEVQAWVTKAMGQYSRWNDDPDQQPQTPTDIITQSMIKYVVDNIMSRLGVIKTAAQAVSVGRELEREHTQDIFNYF